MKRIYITITVFLFTFFLINSLIAQDYQTWKWKHPTPQGNYLRWVKMWDANNWYAIGYGGTFMRTTNAGVNWYFHHKASFPTVYGGSEILYCAYFFNQSTGLVAGSNGLYRTTNGGTSFDSVQTLSTSGTIYFMYFMNSTTGYVAGTSSIKVYKTTNAGLNWAPILNGSYSTAYDVYASDTNNIIVASSSGNVYKTTNAGVNWATISTGASATLYAMEFINANTGFVTGSSGTFRYTTNAGDNWTTANTPITSTMYYLYWTTTGGTTIYTVGSDAYNIYRTTNFGTNWETIPNLDPTQPWTTTWYAMDGIGSNLVTVGAYGMINKSTNNGANWTALNNWKFASTFYDVWCEYNDGKVWAVGSTGAGYDQIAYSTNGGTTWSIQNSNSTATFRGIKMITATTGYICGYSGAVRKTTNGGTSWDSLPVPTTTSLYALDFVNAATGYVFGSSGASFKTTDGGANWALVTTGTTSTLYSGDFITANYGWIVGSSGAVRKTTDGGLTWTAQTPNFTSTIYKILMADTTYGVLCGSSGTVRRTTNGGTTWDTVYTPNTATLYTLSAVNPLNGIIGGSSGFTAKTTNGGLNWTIGAPTGYSNTIYGLYMKTADSIWACGSSAFISKYATGIVGITTWEHNIPLTYTLEQNYPNPFNPTTTIKFGLPKAGNVTLKIYDITGREVASLFNNQQFNAGTISQVFDARELASGIYFYSLIVDNDLKASKKMVVLK